MSARGPHSLPAWQAVADATGIGRGTRVLEVGCGTGGFCAVAAARGASVSGLDADAELLAAARSRVPGGDFRAGRMELLPWGDDVFDVVAGINAFQYADDVDAALAEARRVTRPDGSVVACKWGAPHESDLFAVVGAVLRLQGRPAPPHRDDAPDPLDPLAAAARRAGLRPLTTGDVAVTLELADFAALEAALLRTGGLTESLERIGEAGVRRALREASAPFEQGDGSYRLRNTYRYMIATA